MNYEAINRRLAVEVMGWHEAANTYQWDNHRDWMSKKKWQPQSNIEQALMCAVKLSQGAETPEFSFHCMIEEGESYWVLGYPSGKTKRFKAIYTALVAALEEMEVAK